jgi:hypothetical protein
LGNLYPKWVNEISMSSSQDLLVFVYLGKRLPKYAIESINFALKNSKMPIVLISNIVNLPKFESLVEHYFYANVEKSEFTEVDEKFRNGFWIKTTERFFALEEFMKVRNIEKCFHAELDNVIFNISNVSVELDKIGDGIFVPRDHEDRAIGSLVYVNSLRIYSDFCQFARSHNYCLNDMEILADFLKKYPDKAFPLSSSPVLEIGIDVKNLKVSREDRLYEVGLFDAAAIGQWYFGIDPRNTRRKVTNRFKNEKYSGDLSDFWLTWDEPISKMSLSSKTQVFTEKSLFNLHIHSKIHKKLLKRGKFEKIISLTNRGNTVIIKRNSNGLIRYVVEIIRLVLRRVLAR